MADGDNKIRGSILVEDGASRYLRTLTHKQRMAGINDWGQPDSYYDRMAKGREEGPTSSSQVLSNNADDNIAFGVEEAELAATRPDPYASLLRMIQAAAAPEQP